jgi:hypothetical protein
MRIIFSSLLLILISIQSSAQTTSFKDNRWFDYKKYPSFYDHPIHEQAEVIVSADSLIVHLGSKVLRYKVKGVTDVSTKNKSSREFKVDDHGTEATVAISRTMEDYFGKRRQIAWINGDGWIIMVPLTAITPVGYLFPGDVAIDISAERTRIVGYYDYDFMRRLSAEEYKRADASRAFNSFITFDDKCKKDIQIDLRADGTGTWWSGQTAKDCAKKEEQAFKWKLEQVVMEGRRAMMLTLTADVETNQYIIDELTDKKLTLKGEFNIDEKDTTSEAYLSLSRKKKK